MLVVGSEWHAGARAQCTVCQHSGQLRKIVAFLTVHVCAAHADGDGVPRDNFRGAEIVDVSFACVPALADLTELLQRQHLMTPCTSHPQEQSKFDATQYSFFGDNAAAEALGGLDLDGELEVRRPSCPGDIAARMPRTPSRLPDSCAGQSKAWRSRSC